MTVSELRQLAVKGDCLLYKPHNLMGWVIAVKCWTPICHVEVYDGEGHSLASRDGLGVGRWESRVKGLAAIRRPKGKLDLVLGARYFNSVRGQGYDWMGLLCFTLAVHQGSPYKQFCSEFGLNYYRSCLFYPVAGHCSPDHTAPSEFDQSAEFDDVWRS